MMKKPSIIYVIIFLNLQEIYHCFIGCGLLWRVCIEVKRMRTTTKEHQRDNCQVTKSVCVEFNDIKLKLKAHISYRGAGNVFMRSGKQCVVVVSGWHFRQFCCRRRSTLEKRFSAKKPYQIVCPAIVCVCVALENCKQKVKISFWSK